MIPDAVVAGHASRAVSRPSKHMHLVPFALQGSRQFCHVHGHAADVPAMQRFPGEHCDLHRHLAIDPPCFDEVCGRRRRLRIGRFSDFAEVVRPGGQRFRPIRFDWLMVLAPVRRWNGLKAALPPEGVPDFEIPLLTPLPKRPASHQVRLGVVISVCFASTGRLSAATRRHWED